MAQTFNVVYFGPPEQRVVVKPTAMTKLEVVLAEACAKFKPPLDPAGHGLQFQKKPVDLQGTVRLSNLPNHSRLDVVKVEAPSAQPAAAAAAAAAAGTHTSTSTSHSTQQERADRTAGQAADAPATTAPPAGADETSATAVPGPGSSAAAAAGSSSTLLGPGVLLFTHEALEQAMAAHTRGDPEDEPLDDFYELTPEDYFNITGAQERRKKENNHFKTAALREEEEKKRAASYGPVMLRLHLPEGVIIQATFAATDPLSKVKALLLQAVRPEVAASVHLYTTPPRQVLKDMDATLHHSQLVPAAHVHVGVADAGPGTSLLRPELSSSVKHELDASFQPFLHHEQPAGGSGPGGAAASRAGGSGSTAAAAGARGASTGGDRAAGGGKAPKWLKLGPR